MYADAAFCSKCTLESNEQLYGNLPHLSATIRLYHMKFVGHCCQAKENPISKVFFSGCHRMEEEGMVGLP